MAEKKNQMMGFMATDSLKREIEGLADMEGLTVSSYIQKTLADHVASKKHEVMVLAEALGININIINGS